MSSNEHPAETEGDSKKTHRLERIFLDVSLETPNSPEIFTMQGDPDLNVDIDSHNQALGNDMYETVLSVTATAKLGDTTAFLIEVNQAGIYKIQGYDDQRLDRLLNVFCLRQLYPYSCSTICDLVAKAGFPQLLLAPLNFRQLYENRLNAAGAAADTGTTESTDNELAEK